MVLFKPIVRYCLLCYLLALVNTAISADNIDILISNNPQSILVAKSLKHKLLKYKSDIQFNDISITESSNYQAEDSASLTISVGTKATQRLFNSNPIRPFYSLMIPRATYQSLLKNINNQQVFSALYLDQPLERYFQSMQKLMPSTKTIGVFIVDESTDKFADQYSMAKSYGLELISKPISNLTDPISEINELFFQVDCIVLLPENVANQLLIKWILFSAYKYKKPVFAFSSYLLEAGAIASLHTDLESLATEAATDLINFLQSGKFKQQPRYANDYKIQINPAIAHSLGISFSETQKP